MSDGEGPTETQKRIRGLLDFSEVDDGGNASFDDNSLNSTQIGDTTTGSVFGATNLDVSRRSAFGGQNKDLVGILGHGKFMDPMAARFQVHQSGRKRAYTIRTKGCPHIVHLGAEEPGDGAFDYIMAMVNKRTRAVEYRNVKVVRFEARHTEDKDALMFSEGDKQKANYDLDNSTTAEEFRAKRQALVASFGSAKSIKIQEQRLSRKINDGTLDAMNASALNSVNVDVQEYPSGESKNFNISQLNAEPISQTLPPAVEDAEMPSMVYPTSIFVEKGEVKLYSEAALRFLDQKLADLVQAGMAKCILRFKPSANSDERAVLLVMLATMIRFIQAMRRGQPHVFFSEILKSGIPEPMIHFVRQKFFRGEPQQDRRNKSRLLLPSDEMERERLIAYVLCLSIVMDPSLSLPLTPFSSELKLAEPRMIKVLTALGCTIIHASQSEALQLNTTRIARLQGPPSKMMVKRFVRGKK
ncbi:hypothetical protein L596_018684 [Steinernema carpocapsae]|uniref:RNA polymerase I associated factor, A49-like protein n=1 Tax=Steinernema carpocapsae TaxID=34508 RepID=A0A4U5N6H2_STECR|nr:hypothetical protein L596_018684 [Steinernema carpocapsae]